jgi:hypothetical protein
MPRVFGSMAIPPPRLLFMPQSWMPGRMMFWHLRLRTRSTFTSAVDA